MNPRAQELLMRWIIHVMKMLVGLVGFSKADREELAQITLELDTILSGAGLHRAHRGNAARRISGADAAAGHNRQPCAGA